MPTEPPIDSDIRRPISLSVVHADGTEEAVPEGGVVIEAGANIDLVVPESNDIITLSAQAGAGSEDPYYRQKYDALASLTELNDAGNPLTGPYFDPDLGFTPEGPAWSFTRESLWIGAINAIFAARGLGAFFLNSSACANVGQFDTEDGYPEILAAELAILDICIPCQDCETYNRLNEYIRRISEFYNYQLQLLLNEDTENPPVHPDGGTPNIPNGLFHQFMTCQRFWDYLVHNASVKFEAEGQGQAIITALYYNNLSTGVVGDAGGNGITVTQVYEFYRNGVPWNGVSASLLDPRLISRQGTDDPPNNIRTYTLNAVYAATTMTLTSTTYDDSVPGPRLLPSGGVLYSDIAVLMLDFENVDDGANYYVDVTMTIDRTHLIEGSNPLGERTITRRVYFVPPAPEASSVGGP